MMYGLIEVDVTDTRRAIRQYRAQTGARSSADPSSSPGARAVGDDRAMHAYGWRRRLVSRTSTMGIMVERQVAGEKVLYRRHHRPAPPTPKTPVQVQEEIETAQAADTDAVAVRSLPHWLRPLAVRGLSVWLALPAPLRRLVWGLALRDPYRRKRLTGTVGVTAVGMFGRRAGWGVAPMALAHPGRRRTIAQAGRGRWAGRTARNLVPDARAGPRREQRRAGGAVRQPAHPPDRKRRRPQAADPEPADAARRDCRARPRPLPYGLPVQPCLLEPATQRGRGTH
ncbi:MAG: hypothetical protein U0531_08830 [Dehalococcoidia bacterium]